MSLTSRYWMPSGGISKKKRLHFIIKKSLSCRERLFYVYAGEVYSSAKVHWEGTLGEVCNFVLVFSSLQIGKACCQAICNGQTYPFSKTLCTYFPIETALQMPRIRTRIDKRAIDAIYTQMWICFFTGRSL